jgi:hypothetical protein
MPHVCSLNFLDFENRQELMVTQFEERIALAFTYLFEIENILVKSRRLLNVIHLDGDMIASINLHAHMSDYLKTKRCARHFFGAHLQRRLILSF